MALTAAQLRSIAGTGFFLVGPGVTPDATPNGFFCASAAWTFVPGTGGGGGGGAIDQDNINMGTVQGGAAAMSRTTLGGLLPG